MEIKDPHEASSTSQTNEANDTNDTNEANQSSEEAGSSLPHPPSPWDDQPIGDQRVSPVQDRVSPPARPKGPNASPIVLGLVALVLASVVIAQETIGLNVDWSRLGPGAIVAIGFVMLTIGAIGLVRRHDDT